ncbi:MAG: amidohydrolase [Chloroflexi bacterium]|mgnify:CR=1 FL=1|nr:amidohydrolase [Chloroflexota bacterium]MBL01574.1 amidohydrolase [Chloroflexota bacterium]|tara:strand:+ start:39941 stop:40777 length:837 start_codon:yes stop_codon:yes gene_type:complete
MGKVITIDSHQHFWEIDKFDYSWMDQKSPLRKDYGPKDLAKLINKNQVNKTIIVQAVPSTEETYWLLEIAEKYDFIAGVVGWVDLTDQKIEKTLNKLQENKYFKGVRHLWETDEDPQWIINSGAIRGLKIIAERNLTFDFLARPKNLIYIPKIMSLVPNLRAVLDHVGKPEIAEKKIQPWLSDLRKIASIDNVFCKLSGMITEANHENWNIDDLRPYVHHALSLFGVDRIMFGSDWPVCTLAGQYKDVKNSFDEILKDIDHASQNKIFGENASKFYKI